MAGRSAVMGVRIVGDGTSAARSFRETETAARRFEGAMDRAASTAAFAKITSGLATLATSSMKAAADAEQNIGAAETVFGSAADTIINKSKQAANEVGMSASSYQQLAANIGGSMRNAVGSQDELAAKTQELITAGADLSSVFGGSAADAVSAMGAALRGEFDPLEQFGVFLNASAVSAELAARGQDKLEGAAGEAAKKVAIQSLIMKQASAYTGNFGRESDTAAGAQQRAAAAWEDAKAALGGALLPVIVAVSGALSGFSRFVQENSAVMTPLLLVLGAVVFAIVAFNAVMVALPAIQALATAAQWAWNAAMTANPIGLVIVLIGLLIAIVVVIAMNFDKFKKIVAIAWEGILAGGRAVFNWFGTLGAKIGEVFAGAGRWLMDAGRAIIDGFLGGLRDAWNNVTSFISGIGPWIAANKGPISYDRTLLRPAGAAIMGGLNDSLRAGMQDTKSLVGQVNGVVGGIGSRAGGTSLPGGPGLAGAGGVNTVINVTINGAVDTAETARQVRDVLNSYARSQGTTVSVGSGVGY